MENLNIKLILSSENNYEYKHTIDNIDINLIADVVENVNLYKTEEIIKAIKIIKLSKKGDYKEIINEWVMIIMDILVEFYLFILNKKPYYCICQYCNNPILYTYFENNLNKKSINNENNIISIEGSLAQFNEYNKVDFDNSIYKSMKICSNLNNIFFSNNFFKNPIEDYKKKYEKLNNNNIHFPANPPKKGEKSINIIYHDENYKIFQESINKDARRFEEACKGTFIFSNSMEIFKTIIQEIQSKNAIQTINKFLLITTGRTFEKVVEFLNSNPQYSELISKACIYCMRKKKYLELMSKYELLGGVFDIPSDVVDFIEENSSEDNVKFDFSKLVTYENYISKYYELHKIISKYYSKISRNSIYDAIDLIKDIFNETNMGDEQLYEMLETFQNDDYEIIIQYTDNFYSYVNKWLLNLNNLTYEKSGYFIGGLMYKLNEYGINKRKGLKQNFILYRGLYINYLDALSYQIHKGKIISFQTFLSTSENKSTAEFFSHINRKTIEERKEKCMFSTILNIKYDWDKDLFPLCFNISEITNFRSEKEYLFHPFSFFKINDFKIDISKNILELSLETIGKTEILEEQIKNGKKIILNEKKKIIEIKN